MSKARQQVSVGITIPHARGQFAQHRRARPKAALDVLFPRLFLETGSMSKPEKVVQCDLL
jgi:hypothetical protein